MYLLILDNLLKIPILPKRQTLQARHHIFEYNTTLMMPWRAGLASQGVLKINMLERTI